MSRSFFVTFVFNLTNHPLLALRVILRIQRLGQTGKVNHRSQFFYPLLSLKRMITRESCSLLLLVMEHRIVTPSQH